MPRAKPTGLDADTRVRLLDLHVVLGSWVLQIPTGALRDKLTECGILVMDTLTHNRFETAAELDKRLRP